MYLEFVDNLQCMYEQAYLCGTSEAKVGMLAIQISKINKNL